MKHLYVALLIALPILGQDEKAGPNAKPPAIVKFIELKHLSGDRLNRVTGFVQQFHIGRARVVNDPVLKTLAIQGDTQADVAAAEEMIRRFDVPAAETRTRQIQVVIYLLEPSEQEATGAGRAPVAIASAVEQLRTAFGHKHFRLVETTIMQGRENGSFQTTGLLNAGTPTSTSLPTTYSARFKTIYYNEAQKTVGINGFVYHLRVPLLNGHFSDSELHTDLTIKEGQKLVIGKVTKDQNEHSGFLVVTAKVE